MSSTIHFCIEARSELLEGVRLLERAVPSAIGSSPRTFLTGGGSEAPAVIRSDQSVSHVVMVPEAGDDERLARLASPQANLATAPKGDLLALPGRGELPAASLIEIGPGGTASAEMVIASGNGAAA